MFTILSRRILHNLRVCNNDLHNVFKLIEYNSYSQVRHNHFEKKILLIYENYEYWEPVPDFTIYFKYGFISSNKFGNLEIEIIKDNGYLIQFNTKNYNVIDHICEHNKCDGSDPYFDFCKNKLKKFIFNSAVFNILEIKFTIKCDALFNQVISYLSKIKNKISKIEMFMKNETKQTVYSAITAE